MNIIIPASSFYPSQEGGPSNALYWLASGLASNGHSVKVVTTNRMINDSYVKTDCWINLNGFDVVYTTKEKFRKQYLNGCLDYADLVIANGVCSLFNFFFNLRALRLGKKLILSPRGELFRSAIYHKGRVFGSLKLLAFFIMRLAYGKRTIYHSTSLEETETIKRVMGKNARIVLIPNYMILPERILYEHENTTDPYLLYVGRINEIKNLDVLIESVAKSRVFMTGNYRLYLAGEKKGTYYDSLLRIIEQLQLSNKVFFLGLVTGERKNVLYSGAKCLLLLSKSENFGNVIVEALSQGTPVIASKGTPWHCLEESGAGFWVEVKSDSVANRLDYLLSISDDDYLRMRESAYSLSRDFDIYSNIYKWEQLLIY